MASLERLKWIPMLVKAYTEARIRSDTGTQPMPDTVTSSKSAEAAARPSVEGASASKKVHGVTHVLGKHQGRSRTKVTKSTARRRPTHWKPAQTKQYQFMLRELRQTRLKLERLESIDSRLDEINRYIEQLKEVINTSERNSGGNVSHADSERR